MQKIRLVYVVLCILYTVSRQTLTTGLVVTLFPSLLQKTPRTDSLGLCGENLVIVTVYPLTRESSYYHPSPMYRYCIPTTTD